MQTKFGKLKIGAIFKYNGMKYRKISPEMLGCCTVDKNAYCMSTGKKILIHDRTIVDVIAE